MGIAKKNSILLVDFTNQVRTEGMNALDALIHACPIRLRPIVMTSVATIAGAIPAALSIGPGSESRIPMAITVIGGVIISTFFTLYLVPAVYLVMTRFENRKSLQEQEDEDMAADSKVQPLRPTPLGRAEESSPGTHSLRG
jgi:Cu/Ag efflux pump CusA